MRRAARSEHKADHDAQSRTKKRNRFFVRLSACSGSAILSPQNGETSYRPVRGDVRRIFRVKYSTVAFDFLHIYGIMIIYEF